MDVKIPPQADNTELSIDFELNWTRVRLGNSNRYFKINLDDTSFPIRLDEGYSKIKNFMENKSVELNLTDSDNIAIKKDMSTEDIDKYINIQKEIESFIRGILNDIFGYDISTDVFGDASCISVTRKGEYYFENFLNAVIVLVEKEYRVRIKAGNNRIKQYTSHKGTHPAILK